VYGEKIVASDPKNGAYLNTLGAVLYRAGRFDEAAERLAEAETAYQATPDPSGSIIYSWLFLAMTHHHLGHTEPAREWLAKAAERIEQTGHGESRDAGTGAWNRKLAILLLRREAEKLLGGNQESSASPLQPK